MYLGYKKINYKIITLFICALSIFIFSPILVNAIDYTTEDLGGLSDTAVESGYETDVVVGETKAANQIAIVVGQIIKVIISLIGVIFAILVFMGGFDIISANGNEELVKKGKERIIDGAKGILVVLVAYTIAAMAITWATQGGWVADF